MFKYAEQYASRIQNDRLQFREAIPNHLTDKVCKSKIINDLVLESGMMHRTDGGIFDEPNLPPSWHSHQDRYN